MEIMKQSRGSYARGFTLIELLVVISIVGLLSSFVMASLNDARISAQYTVAKQAMKQISDATMLLSPDGTRLMSVTGSNCSDCVCRYEYGGPADLKNIPNSDVCMTNWISAITKIDSGSTLINNTQPYLRDPWGSPYLLDENELEHDPTDCVHDAIRTAGPDGQTSTPDDYIYFIPLRTSNCAGKL